MVTLSGGQVGVSAVESGITIMNCVIRDMSDAGVVVTGVAEVINNTIVRNEAAGIRATGRACARNNIVQDNGVGLAGVVESTYNDVSDGYAVCVPGIGDLSAPVSFLDPASGDYREQANQPSLDGGAPTDPFALEPAWDGRRINMGAFGNTASAATSTSSLSGRSTHPGSWKSSPASNTKGCGGSHTPSWSSS
jgi:hypothetical protein